MENFDGTYSGVMTDGENVFYELTVRSDGGYKYAMEWGTSRCQ